MLYWSSLLRLFWGGEQLPKVCQKLLQTTFNTYAKARCKVFIPLEVKGGSDLLDTSHSTKNTLKHQRNSSLTTFQGDLSLFPGWPGVFVNNALCDVCTGSISCHSKSKFGETCNGVRCPSNSSYHLCSRAEER